MILQKIVSGGQTGADQSALDFAISKNISHGGWCPRGRIAENGLIPERFLLKETPDEKYSLRTEWNVRDSDATVILTISARLTGGSGLTMKLCKRWKRPCVHLSRERTADPGKTLADFIEENMVQTLNVAGPRDSTEPGVGRYVTSVLEDAWQKIG